MASIVNISAKGLNTHPNSLGVPEGSLIQADDVIIERDDVIEPRRGFKLYAEGFGTSSDRIKQLGSYRGRILRHYNDILQYQSNGEVFNSFLETVNEVDLGLRIKFIESNGNLYFTTADGIKKISSASGAGLSNADITNAGGIKALDGEAELVVTPGNQAGFLPQDSAVAYRAVWGKTDANNNLILGTPSQRIVIYNPLTNLILSDYLRLLGALDSISTPDSMINDGNYVLTLKLPITATPNELLTSLEALCTKLDKDILYADNNITLSAYPPFEIDTVVISSGSCVITFDGPTDGANVEDYFTVGDKVFLDGTFTPVSGALEGLQTITEVNSVNNSISFATAATGAVTINSSSKVESGRFRSITVAPEPNIPATNDDLVDLQNYLDLIIQNLQLLTAEKVIAEVTATAPLEIDELSCSVLSNVATITFSSGDPRSRVYTGSYIYLEGFTPINGTLEGVFEVVSVTSTTITVNVTADDGAIAVDSDAFINKVIHFTNDQANDVIDVLDITTTANVKLNLTIPKEVTSSTFLQIYRSNIAQATGVAVLSDLTPNDEMQLVYENFPTEQEVEDGTIYVTDITPEAFKGANLYTNATTGEGITQANDIPPFAKDVNRYKNTVFYANTRTRYRKSLSLLGVSNLIEELDAGRTPKLTISTDEDFHTYSFVKGIKQITQIVTDGISEISTGAYIELNSAYDEKFYHIWFDLTGNDIEPIVSNSTGIRVVVFGLTTATEIAEEISNSVAISVTDFTSSFLGNLVTIVNSNSGPATDAEIVTGLSGAFNATTFQQGVGESATQQIVELECGSGASLTSGDYFTIPTAFNKEEYGFYYVVDNSIVIPPVSNLFLVPINVLSTDTDDEIATKTGNILTHYFITEVTVNLLEIKNTKYGPCQSINITNLPGSFSFDILQTGLLQVEVSTSVSPAIALDETTRSLLRIINKNKSEILNGYYLSGVLDVPGKFLLEAQDLSDAQFYLITNNKNVGDSFNPVLSPKADNSGTTITFTNAIGLPTVITTSSAHGLSNLDNIVITNSNSIPSLDGSHEVTIISSTSFSINKEIRVAGTTGSFALESDLESGDNEAKENRVYYSKFQQPEAVPLVNYFDVGAEDEPILRVFPLRDSLFVFKTDGVYRISGEAAPFNLSLFDSSCILKAPDSLAVLGNLLYGFTTQGISTVSEAGINVVSSPIDSTIRLISSSQYVNFSKVTFGLSYESDDSYLIWTNSKTTDTSAPLCYRYSARTNTWTIFNVAATCGINFGGDDKLYLGTPLENSLLQERKEFSRTDYADREFEASLTLGNYFNKVIKLNDVSRYKIGDVLTQTQLISNYDFNQLLKKLDFDTGVADGDYFSTLESSPGENIRTNIIELAQKLDNDTGVNQNNFASTIASLSGTITNIQIGNNVTLITCASHGLFSGRQVLINGSDSVPTINEQFEVTVINANVFSIPISINTSGSSGSFSTLVNDFNDIKACYNKIIEKLNTDISVAFNNYQQVNTQTTYECIIDSIDKNAKTLTLSIQLPFIVGPLVIFESINSKFVYAPLTMGDALGLKQIREATFMYNNKNFTKARIEISTDLIPQPSMIPITGMGNGIFGNNHFGSGLFGGIANSTPTRTYIPSNKQRCRFLVVGFSHSIAREKYEVYGMTLTGRVGISSRAYK